MHFLSKGYSESLRNTIASIYKRKKNKKNDKDKGLTLEWFQNSELHKGWYSHIAVIF